jgi:hypothetical protein
MSRPSTDRGSRPAVQAGFYFQQMAYGGALGDYITAGRAQRELERLGWLIRRLEPRDLGDDGESNDAGPALSADAVLDDALDNEDVEADEADGTDPEDHPLGVAGVSRLVGLNEDELDEAIEAGRFPLPDGYVSLRPYWERETIGWWVKRGRAL